MMHIENQTSDVQAEIYAAISQAAESGIQLTTMDFTLIDGSPTLDGMSPTDWLAAITQR